MDLRPSWQYVSLPNTASYLQVQLTKGFSDLTGNCFQRGRASRFTVKQPAVEVKNKKTDFNRGRGAAPP